MNTQNPADQSTAYIGLCRFERFQDHDGTHLVAEPGQTLPTFEGAIACWVSSAVEYDELLTAALPAQGCRLLRTEEVMPISAWFAMKGFNAALGELAAKVSPSHRFEVGIPRPVAFAHSHGMQAGAQVGEAGYIRLTGHVCPPLPDQSHLPFWDHDWIAPELKDLLFAQPEQGGPLNTYFVVDGTLRKNITRVFDLDTPLIDVPIRCLFKGEAAVELQEVAPYLIDMTLPDGAWDDPNLVPGFHKKFFADHWGHETGIFIRSTASMETVWNNLRKLTKVNDQFGKIVYFRFWVPSTFYPLGRYLSQTAKHVHSLFPHVGDQVLFEHSRRETVVQFTRVRAGAVKNKFTIDQALEDRLCAYTQYMHVIRLMKATDAYLREMEPDLIPTLEATPQSVQFGIAKDLLRLEILDTAQAAAIISIIHRTKLNMLTEKSFNYVTKNTLLSPSAKAIQLILGFATINKAMKE